VNVLQSFIQTNTYSLELRQASIYSTNVSV